MDGVIRQVQFTRQARGGLTFAAAAQQQNDLGGSQMLVGKHRTGVDGVHCLTLTAAMLRHMATAGLPEAPCPLDTRSAGGTAQTFRVKVLAQPHLTQLVIADVENRKIHSRSVMLYLGTVNRPSISLGMSHI